MRRILLIMTAVSVFALATPVPDANAFLDPVTIMILAPIALKAAAIAKPYVIRGLINLGKHFVKMGVAMLEFMRMPVGFIQMTLGAPFGGLGPGLKNIVKGGLGMGKLIVRAVMLPVAIFGLSI